MNIENILSYSIMVLGEKKEDLEYNRKCYLNIFLRILFLNL